MTIRILQIISGFAIEGPLGGIERFGIELAKALDKTQVTPIVCGLWAYNTPFEYGWVEHLRAHGIEAFIPADWDETSPYLSFVRTMQAMRAMPLRVDVIHSHCQFGDLAALLLKRRYQAKHLMRTVHNEREWSKRPLRKLLLTNGLYPFCFQPEIGVAQQVVDNLNARPVAKLFRRKAQLQYNALNLERFQQPAAHRAETLKELDIPTHGRIVGTIGRLSAQKGIDVLIDAADIVLAKDPDIYLLIVGNGDLEQALKHKSKQSVSADRIRFLGARNDIEALLACFDVFVSSSLWEGLPTVIMESMAAGVPIVATNVGGNAELVKNNERGYLVNPSQPTELALAILRILNNSEKENYTLIRNSAEFVAATFSIQRVAKSHERLYCALA